MAKILKFFIFFLIMFIPFSLIGKVSYIITLKGGTKIKADSYIEKKGYIKVFKYGGYIIYPKKNIKSIKKLNTYSVNSSQTDNNSKNSKSKSSKSVKKCMPVVKNFEAIPVYDAKKDGFDIKVTGLIDNNCPKILENVKLTIKFYDKNNNNLLTKTIPIKNILSFDSYKFEHIIKDEIKGDIKYYNYKLEFLKK